MTISYLLAALRRRPWLPLVCAVLFLILASQVVSSRTPYYEATTLILVQPPASVGAYDTQQYVAGQASLIEGSALASVVASDFTDESTVSIQEATTVTQLDNGQTIEIAVLLPDAALATNVANRYAQAYVEEQNTRNDTYYGSQLSLLNDNADVLAADIQTRQEELSTIDPNTQSRTELSRQARISAELTTIQTEYNQIQASIRQLELDRGRSPGSEIVQPAVQPESPAGLPNIAIIVVIEILGLILGAVLAVFAALWSGKVVDDDHVAEVAQGTVIGSMPKVNAFKEGPKTPLVDRAPAVDRLCDELLVRAGALSAASDGPAKIVVVASRRGVGTTTLAVALAARSEARRYETLLVDADRRHPYLGHELVQGTPRFNLSTFTEAIGQTTFDNEPWRRLTSTAPHSEIAVLPMDSFRPELTSSSQFEQLDRAFARISVDNIIIDGGAVLDSVAIGRLTRTADAIVLMVPKHRESIKVLEACAATLRVDSDRLLIVTTPLSGGNGDEPEPLVIAEQPRRIVSGPANAHNGVPSPPQTARTASSSRK